MKHNCYHKCLFFSLLFYFVAFDSYSQSTIPGTSGKPLSIFGNRKRILLLEQQVDSLITRMGEVEELMNDSDKDGVPDYLDREQNSIAGVAVDMKGEMNDVNQNGIPDNLEKYFNQQGRDFPAIYAAISSLQKEINIQSIEIEKLKQFDRQSELAASNQERIAANKKQLDSIASELKAKFEAAKDSIIDRINSTPPNTDSDTVQALKEEKTLLNEKISNTKMYLWIAVSLLGLGGVLASITSMKLKRANQKLEKNRDPIPLFVETIYCSVLDFDDHFITTQAVLKAGTKDKRFQERVFERKLVADVLPDKLKKGDLFEVEIIDSKGQKTFKFKKSEPHTAAFFDTKLIDAAETIKKYYALNKKADGR